MRAPTPPLRRPYLRHPGRASRPVRSRRRDLRRCLHGGVCQKCARRCAELAPEARRKCPICRARVSRVLRTGEALGAVAIRAPRARGSSRRGSEKEHGPRRRRAELVRVDELALRPLRALGVEMYGWDSLTGDWG